MRNDISREQGIRCRYPRYIDPVTADIFRIERIEIFFKCLRMFLLMQIYVSVKLFIFGVGGEMLWKFFFGYFHGRPAFLHKL